MRPLTLLALGNGIGLVVLAVVQIRAGGIFAHQVERPSATAYSDSNGGHAYPLRDTDIAVELAALRHETASLRLEVERLKSTSSATARPSDLGAPEPVDRGDDNRLRQERMEAVEVAFRAETTHTSWSRQSTSVVREALKRSPALYETMRAIDCRSRTCRVELRNPGTGEFSQSLAGLSSEIGSTFSQAIVSYPGKDGRGEELVVLYLSNQSSS